MSSIGRTIEDLRPGRGRLVRILGWISTPASPLVTSERACFSQSFSAGGHHSAGSTPGGAKVVSSDSSTPDVSDGWKWVYWYSGRSFCATARTPRPVTRLRSALASAHLDDHHVAAVALAPLDVAAGRGAGLDGRDDLEEVVADRADDVDQAPLGDAGIAIGDLDAQDVAQFLARAFQVLG